GPCCVVALGLLLPAAVLSEGSERRVGRWRHACEDLARVVRGCGGRRGCGLGHYGRREREQGGQRQRNGLYRARRPIHRLNSPLWRARAPVSAKMHKREARPALWRRSLATATAAR